MRKGLKHRRARDRWTDNHTGTQTHRLTDRYAHSGTGMYTDTYRTEIHTHLGTQGHTCGHNHTGPDTVTET